MKGQTAESKKEKKDEQLVALWTARLVRAKDYQRPFRAKWLRMYKLYRAYRDARNYAYQTNLMPPIGFEIIETIKPRVSAAKMKINIAPKNIANKDSSAIQDWEGLMEYYLSAIGFDDQKQQWIFISLLLGNGVAQLTWEGEKPSLEIIDPWLLYIDPRAKNGLKESRWEIKQSFTERAIISKQEKNRAKKGGDYLYTILDKETGKRIPLIKSKQWLEKEIQDQGIDAEKDLRYERYEINTLKMGQINDGRQKTGDIEQSQGESQNRKEDQDKGIEILECYDHINNRLVTIFNRQFVVRNEKSPYAEVNEGQTFYDLPDIPLPWEYFAMSHLEPVESTIHEIADSRNQAMDDIIFSLDPIRKVKKSSGLEASDLKHEPGATWKLNNVDDVVFQSLPEVSRSWIEKDSILRKEISSSLALSEYTSGIPHGSQEPASKVEILLMQTNIRLSGFVRQMEVTFGAMANSLIQMTRLFLDEEFSYRILGKNFRFGQFKDDSKDVEVDAWVDITPKQEKSPEQQAKEIAELYKMLVIDDQPDATIPEEVQAAKKKKRVLQRLFLESRGYGDYADQLITPDSKPKPTPGATETTVQGEDTTIPTPQAPTIDPTLQTREPMLTPTAEAVEQATPQGVQARPGLLGSILSRFKR